MLVIRLARGGRAKYPTYRIVAAESSRAATGKFVAVLGHYNPHTKQLVMKREEVVTHLKNGAQPSNTVVKLLMREKVELPSWVKLKTKAPRPKDETKEEPKAEEVTEAVAAAEADAGEEATAEAVAAQTDQKAEESAPEAADSESN